MKTAKSATRTKKGNTRRKAASFSRACRARTSTVSNAWLDENATFHPSNHWGWAFADVHSRYEGAIELGGGPRRPRRALLLRHTTRQGLAVGAARTAPSV